MRFLQRIVVPTDFSTSSDMAFSFAVHLARAASAEIHLMHDVEVPVETITGATTVKERLDKAKTEARRKMEELVASREASDVVVERAIQQSTNPVRSISQYAEEHDVDLIVMGAHGHHSFKEKLLGSRAERVLGEASCPVVTVPPHETAVEERLAHIIVPIDFSEASIHALHLAHGLAAACNARISLLHAAAREREENVREKLFDLYEREIGTAESIEVFVSEDSPANAIITVADNTNADLIVISTHGRKGLKQALKGNTADDVIPKAPCPVMTIPAKWTPEKHDKKL